MNTKEKSFIKKVNENHLPIAASLLYVINESKKIPSKGVQRFIESYINKEEFKILKNLKNPYITEERNIENLSIQFIKLYNRALNVEHTDKTLKTVKQRFKKFVMDNPEYSNEDILNGTKLYLKTVDLKYIWRPYYFIFKGVGSNRVSDLEEYIEKYFIENKKIESDVYNTLQ